MTVATQRVKRRQLREETRRQILDAALTFLRGRSYRELSVDEVMSLTGHTRTVFYRHFADIPDLMLTLIDDVGGQVVEVAARWADSDGPVGPDEARARLALFVDFYAENGPVVHAVSEAARHDDAVERAYSQMVEGFVALTTAAIERRVAAGELAPLDAPEIARALVRMLNGYLEDTLGREGGADPARVLDTVATVWNRTLFPGAGE